MEEEAVKRTCPLAQNPRPAMPTLPQLLTLYVQMWAESEVQKWRTPRTLRAQGRYSKKRHAWDKREAVFKPLGQTE